MQPQQQLGAYITPEQASMYARTITQYANLARSNGYILPKGKPPLVTQ